MAQQSAQPAAAEDGDGFDSRLERESAQTGDVQISLLWNNRNDIDLHIIAPNGEHIFYGQAQDRSGGYLDVDMNAGDQLSDAPVENVFWSSGSAPSGRYQVFVNHFQPQGGANPTPFKVRIKNGATVTVLDGTAVYSGDTGPSHSERDSDESEIALRGTDGVPSEVIRVYEFVR